MKPTIKLKRQWEKEIEEMDMFIWARRDEVRPLINPKLPQIIHKSLIRRLPSILVA